MRLVCQRLRNRQIARKLGISVGTVKFHLHSAMEKLDLHSRYRVQQVLERLERRSGAK